MKKSAGLIFINVLIALQGHTQFGRPSPADSLRRDSMNKVTQQDHKQMLGQLNITSLRPGANGNDPKAPNAANYDETKANPYPDLPDALTLKNGKKVTTAKMWWDQRRPEIAEDFDREIYGRTPANLPKVNWEVIETRPDTVGWNNVHDENIDRAC
ncbi:MAG: hypothetical protein WDO16_03030 [Bacteroidota bacterium]